MLTRRSFAGLLSAAAATALRPAAAKTPLPTPSQTPAFHPPISVMMWALQKHGTFEEVVELVAKAGYKNIELVSEWKKWSEADTARILARLQTLGITIDTLTGVDHGFADPANGDAILADLKTVLPVAQRFHAPTLILVSGKLLPSSTPAAQHQACIENLRRAAPLFEAAGITAVIEPIDRLEQPGIYLDGVTEAFEITRAVASPRVKVLYDVYHEQRSQGNLIEKFEKNIDQVGLIHIADVPGRHEPGTGEIHYENIYRKLADLHYPHIMAMEFYPTGDPVETLRQARLETILP